MHANNKGADRSAHLRSLISAFVIRFLGKYNRMLDFSVHLSEQFDSSLTMSHGRTPRSLSPEDRFLARGLSIKIRMISLFWVACADPEGGQVVRTPPPPLIKHKNVGFLHNTGLDPQHHRPASKTPFQWRFAGGPMMAHLYW